jgi:T-complex protein 1 subunit theta
MGDATNMVIVLAGEMLKMAEGLIRIGLHPSDIVAGYEKAQEFALKTLDGMVYIWLFEGYRDLTRAVQSS